MPRAPRNPLFWLAGFLVWFAVLWFMSSRPGNDISLPPFPYSDKLAHFGYFFGGGGLFAAFLFRLDPQRPRWIPLFIIGLLVFAAIGWIDEVHQSFTPRRNGNDWGDWIADITGASTGILVFRRLHRLLL